MSLSYACVESLSTGGAVIAQNVRRILRELPPGVTLVAAAKTRTPQEILQAIEAGVAIVGENYVKEAQATIAAIGSRVKWHFIGHLQRNKVKAAVELFDMIETVDSLTLAKEIDKRCSGIGKIMPVLIEVNSACEQQKAGVVPEEVEGLVREIALLKYVKVTGLMTMGPWCSDPEEVRPYFKATKSLFDTLGALALPGISMTVLSMGMSNSYRVAIDEGATMVRIGAKIFGERSDGQEDREQAL